MLERLTVESRGQIRATTSPTHPSSWMGAVLIALIRVYQWTLAPLFGACCRFEPSCSRYTVSCIQHQGPLRGLWCGIRRLMRCHPFSPGGYDPPPFMAGGHDPPPFMAGGHDPPPFMAGGDDAPSFMVAGHAPPPFLPGGHDPPPEMSS